MKDNLNPGGFIEIDTEQEIANKKEQFKEQVTHECTYHPPRTEEQKENHNRVNVAVLHLIHVLIDICPLSAQLREAISHIKTGRNKANESLAVHVNSKSSEDS